MARPQHTPLLAPLEDVLTVLFCLVDDAYPILNTRRGRYESIKRLLDSESVTLALFQQLRGIASPSSPSCATLGGSSRACSRAWPACSPLRSTAGCAGCGAPSSPSWSATLRRWSWTRRCSRSRTPARSGNRPTGSRG